MCRAVCVLGLLALYVGLAQSWDIAVSLKEQLVFFTNGTKTNTVILVSQNPTALVYDELHNMILYVDKQSNNDTICGYNLSSKENKCFIKRNGRNIHGLAFDPVTETIFFTDTNERSINLISLKPGSNNNVYGNLLFKLDDRIPTNIAVDSCRGYIHWTNKATKTNIKYLERARFNGSEKKVMNLKSYYESVSLAIDLPTQKIFSYDFCVRCSSGHIYSYINIPNLNGQNFKEILKSDTDRNLPKVLTVSKDYIYYTMSSDSVDSVWQFPKNAMTQVKPKEIIKFDNENTLGIITNYKIEDQIKGIRWDCDSLWSLLPIMTVPLGDIGERFDISVCENFCLQGNCSFNDKGLPQCSCDAGYSGNRCQVYACHGYCSNNGTCSLNENSEPVCQCKGHYVGDRCEVSPCLKYCMQGSCSINDDGLPKCSCDAGYSGNRCQVYACHGYCSNNGTCSLNENSEPVCQCKGHYVGDRCEVLPCLNYCMQGSCSINDDGLPKCSCNAGYFGERCEVNACQGYCLNDGDCSLNEEDEPVCQCDGNHEGSRCEAGINDTPKYDAAKSNGSLAYLVSILRKVSSKLYLTVEV